jgi:sodium-dependent dicarboxylate transporter 2/3/5
MGTIIGSPPNAIAVGALAGAGIDVDFLTWMLFGFPIAIVLTLLFWVVLVRTFKIKNLPEVDIPEAPPPTEEEHHMGDRRKKVLVYITIGLTMLLWMTSTLHGIASYIVSVIPIVFLTVGGVVNADDVRALPWDTLMLVAGGLALGISIIDTGLAELYIGKIEDLTTGDIVYPIIFVMALVTVLASNIMSNTATASILIPISIIMFPTDAVMAAVVIGLSASTALFLPISTPPNAIAFSTGQLEQKDFRLSGVFMGLAGPVIIMMWILLLNAVLK